MIEEREQARAAECKPSVLGNSLGPMLIEHCKGQLGPIQWFRADWQRGGAATGFSLWKTDDDSQGIPVMVKVPVGECEYSWTVALSCEDEASKAELHNKSNGALPGALNTPRVFASGVGLEGVKDICWLVMEKLQGRTLAGEHSKKAVVDLIESVVQFHRRSLIHEPVVPEPSVAQWDHLLVRSRESIQSNNLPDAQRWRDAVRKVHRALPKLVPEWRARPINTWCHGDLHLGNAMRRENDPDTCVLIDMALVHPGHWVEDAIYFERQHWGHRDSLYGIKPVSHIARVRKNLGLSTNADYNRLANIRRVLTAACVPVFLAREGAKSHIAASLDILDSLITQVA